LRDRLPCEIHTKPHERAQLLKYGKPLGNTINELITIVTPGTFHRWTRDEKKGPKKNPAGRPGRSAVLRELVLKIAREKGFGYTRILGELRKLSISRIGRQTVKNIKGSRDRAESETEYRRLGSVSQKSCRNTLGLRFLYETNRDTAGTRRFICVGFHAS